MKVLKSLSMLSGVAALVWPPSYGFCQARANSRAAPDSPGSAASSGRTKRATNQQRATTAATRTSRAAVVMSRPACQLAHLESGRLQGEVPLRLLPLLSRPTAGS